LKYTLNFFCARLPRGYNHHIYNSNIINSMRVIPTHNFRFFFSVRPPCALCLCGGSFVNHQYPVPWPARPAQHRERSPHQEQAARVTEGRELFATETQGGATAATAPSGALEMGTCNYRGQ
jgi:hypothetical protein